MSKVSDSATADGSAGWFKFFQDTWAAVSGAATGDSDAWGTKDLNACCGKMDVAIPADLAAGDYLLRAEAIALHTASSAGGAQFYMTCFQLTVTGSGAASPPTVSFPGAYRASDPGILINIHAPMSTYVAPGPAVCAGGSTKVAGSPCSGCESTCTPGSGPAGTAASVPQATPTVGGGGGGGQQTSSPAPDPPSSGGACAVGKYGQCGGTGYTGCGSCGSGLTCSGVSPPYYSQCV